ncbi:MAG TPA: 2OG-Fe(II) oxygenase [Xanthobacteraceae bacterium]|nr:2OG-Fe(II) oxygenase [Xanthobacteraceae bacterium]
MVERLLHFARTQRDGFRASRVRNSDEKELDLTVRRSFKITDLGELRDELHTLARAALPEMSRQLGTGRFEPRKFEIEMVAHGDGAFFTEHYDRNMQSVVDARLISAVYYFHRLPKSFSGGALRIYSLAGRDKSKTFVEIEPVNDTLIFFPSWFPHEVLPVRCPSGQFEDSRFSINCWVHS